MSRSEARLPFEIRTACAAARSIRGIVRADCGPPMGHVLMRMKTLVLMATFVLGCGGKSLGTDGSAGATGSAGSTGNAGAGASGNAGSTGSAGAADTAGATGSAGSTGNAGAMGTVGAAGAGGDAGGTGAGGTAGTPPHRPTAIACPSNTALQDAGVTSCATNTDCRPDGGSVFAAYCHNHACTGDQCFTDSDCGAGMACSCTYPFGHGVAANICVPTGCLVDADCASSLCSPAFGGLCVNSQGYRCRTAQDTCRADSDCPSQTDGGITLPRGCQFVPEVGHWQCAAVSLCAG